MAQETPHTIVDIIQAAIVHIISFGTLALGVVTDDRFIKIVGLVMTFLAMRYYWYATKKVKGKK